MKPHVPVTLISIICAAFGLVPDTAGGQQPDPSKLVVASLLPEVQSIRPGTPFWVGVRLEMADGWHVNWLNPGDAGLPPTIEWHLPEGFETGDIQWPYPTRFDLPELSIFGYDGEVLLLTKITPPRSLASQKINVRADVTWLVCREVCIPGSAELELTLPVRESRSVYSNASRDVFRDTRRMLPAVQTPWTFSASVGRDRIVISATPPKGVSTELDGVMFYPSQLGLIESAAPQILKKNGHSYHLEVRRAALSLEPPTRIQGVLVSERGWGARSGKALAIDVPVE